MSADPGWASCLRSFDEYLTRVTGVSAGTRRIYLRYARAFLATQFGTRAPTWSAVTAAAIADFVRVHAATLTPSECRAPVTATRAFLRFLSTTGVIRPGLDGAVPTVRQWTLTTLPRALTADELERVFAACDDARATGPRDRAVLLLLGRLGLRASEVAVVRGPERRQRRPPSARVRPGESALRRPGHAQVTPWSRPGRTHNAASSFASSARSARIDSTPPLLLF